MSSHGDATLSPDAQVPPPLPSLLLVGNPNVGKSVFFGHLTGRYVVVSNYPGTTIEVAEGSTRLDGVAYRVVDTPGTNRLTPASEDERVTRDLLVASENTRVLQVIDAKNLRRGLMLTVELAELGIPVAIGLNMMDEAADRGVVVREDALRRALGIPVVKTIAVRGEGLASLPDAVACAATPNLRPTYPAPVERALERILALLPDDQPAPRYTALQLLSADEDVARDVLNSSAGAARARLAAAIDEERGRIGPRIRETLQRCRGELVDSILAQVYVQTRDRSRSATQALSDWALHPVRGFLVLAAVLYTTLWFVGLFGAGTLVGLMENGLFGQVVNPAAIRVVDAILPFPHDHERGPIEVDANLPLAPGVSVPTGLHWSRNAVLPEYTIRGDAAQVAGGWRGLLHDLLVGRYGIITMAFAYGIAIVLPIVSTFFVLFSLLEDSGYLPRLAVMLNNVFRSMGLNGKAVLPMVLGLGCDTMATMTARILESKKHRLIVTLLLALGVPCSAQLGVLLAMMARISLVGSLVWGMVVIGSMLAVGHLASRVLPGESPDFVLEIPPIRKPLLKNVLIKTAARVEWYLKEVLPLFVLGTVLLFVLDRTHALVALRNVASPVVVEWLGLPKEAADAFIVGFLRRDYGAVLLLQAGVGSSAYLTAPQVLVCMVVITLFIPCVANVLIISREHGWRVAVGIAAFVFPFAFLVGGIVRMLINVLRIPV